MKYRIVKHWGDDGFYLQKRVLFWWRPATYCCDVGSDYFRQVLNTPQYVTKSVLGKPQEQGGTVKGTSIGWSMWWDVQEECWAGKLGDETNSVIYWAPDFDGLKKVLFDIARSYDHQ